VDFVLHSTNNANQNMNDDIAESRLYEVRDQGGNNVNPGAIQRLNCKENIVIDLNIVPTQSPEVFEPEYQTNEDLSIVGESIVQVPEPSRTAVGWKKRNTATNGPDHREHIPGRASAL